MDALKPISIESVPCKICGNTSPLYGVVDFNRNCEIANGVRLPLCGTAIYYRRCDGCGFLFTDAFDHWNDEQFRSNIYNDSYCIVDPEYAAQRPNSNAEAVVRLWGNHKADTRVLDYGGGNDVLCEVLRTNGFPVAITYDPMVPKFSQRPKEKFELVTCFETLEHLPDPMLGIGQMIGCVADPGVILFTTLVRPPDFSTQRLNWWYIGPRNGHISLFSREALLTAWSRHDYRMISFNDNVHLAFRTLPSFLSKLQR